jgi:hypothetical protein
MAGPAFFGVGTGRSPALPNQIQVRYQGRRCNGAVSDMTVPLWYLSTVNLSDLILPIPTLDGGSPEGKGVLTLKDTALALYNVGGGDPTNKTTLDDLTKQIAQDYVDWQSLEFDQTLNGTVDVITCGILDTIEWTLNQETPQTRITTSPYHYFPEEFQHNDGQDNKLCVDVTGSMGYTVSQAPCVAVYGPLAKCVSGAITLPRYKVCLEDGRLFQKYVQTDTITT